MIQIDCAQVFLGGALKEHLKGTRDDLDRLVASASNRMTSTIYKFEYRQGIVVVTDPSQEEIAKCKSWGTWGCEASKFPWTYGSAETCYLLAGEVTVTPDGGEPVSFKAGDIVTFPAGMSCTWDVKVAVKKHFNFH